MKLKRNGVEKYLVEVVQPQFQNLQ